MLSNKITINTAMLGIKPYLINTKTQYGIFNHKITINETMLGIKP